MQRSRYLRVVSSEQDIQNDVFLKLQVLMLKDKFLTKTQSLLHGDLHTGSVFVSQERTTVFDFEFSCFGPTAFDCGLLVGNLLLNYLAQDGLTDEPRPSYKAWLLKQICVFWLTFSEQYGKLFKLRGTCTGTYPRQWGEKEDEVWLQARLSEMLKETVGFAGVAMIRRVIGIAKADDMVNIPDVYVRAACEKRALLLGRHLILNARRFNDMEAFVEAAAAF